MNETSVRQQLIHCHSSLTNWLCGQRQQNGEDLSSVVVVVHPLNSNSRGSHCKAAAAAAHLAYFNSESGLCGGAIPLHFTKLQPSVVFVAKKADPQNIATMHLDLPLR
jgi:hypothetical protein